MGLTLKEVVKVERVRHQWASRLQEDQLQWQCQGGLFFFDEF